MTSFPGARPPCSSLRLRIEGGAAERFPYAFASAVETAHHRADRDVEDVRRFLVAHAFDVDQLDERPERRWKLVERTAQVLVDDLREDDLFGVRYVTGIGLRLDGAFFRLQELAVALVAIDRRVARDTREPRAG